MFCKPLSIVVPLVGCLAVSLGCRRAEQITVYSVPKPDAIIPEGEAQLTPASRSPRRPAVAAVPTRMLAAMFLAGESGWFFKATGDVEKLAAKEAEFKQFLESVRFPDDLKPTWELPAGWTDRGEKTEFRYTTLIIGNDSPPLELAVSRLDRSQPDEAAFVLANINRWRGQLGLKNLKPDELADSTTLLQIDGKKCYVLNAVGEMAGGGGMRPPFAGGPQATSLPPETATKSSAPASNLKYEKPAGWQDGKLNQFRQAAFEVKEGNKQVEVTVTSFPSGTGTLLANVNRWREQVQLKPVKEEDLQSSVKTIPIGNKEGKYVALLDSEDGGKGLLGVILETDDRMWFVKLIGDVELARKEQSSFEAFVKSLRVP